jgi:O-methyltransferase involved in polyketide biosynthesis
MTKPVDTSKPNMARMYDYWLGGKDNFEVDRKAAEAVRRLRPNVAEQALDNKRFQTRAVTYAASHGVRQFLDIGSGLPTSPVRTPGAEPLWLATHEAARAVVPDAMVAYVDHDPVAVLHSQALLGGGRREVVAVAGDMHDPAGILTHAEIRAAGFDLDAPACVVLACVLHFVDAETAQGIVSTLVRALAPGSYVVISVGFGRGQAGTDFASRYNAQDGPRIYAHSWEEITGFFAGLELVPPGIVETSAWQPGQPDTGLDERSNMIVAGVGRRLTGDHPAVASSQPGGGPSYWIGNSAPRSAAGRGPKIRRCDASIGTSLMLASRRRIRPCSSNSQSSLP